MPRRNAFFSFVQYFLLVSFLIPKNHLKNEKQDGREGETEEQPDKYPSRLRTYIYDYIYYLILKKDQKHFFLSFIKSEL